MQPSRQHTKALSAMHSTKQSDYLPWKSRFLERLNLGRNALPVIRPVYAFACFLLCGSNVTCRQGISKSSGEPTRHGVEISSALQMAITRQGISQKSLAENHSSCLEKDVLDSSNPPLLRRSYRSLNTWVYHCLSNLSSGASFSPPLS